MSSWLSSWFRPRNKFSIEYFRYLLGVLEKNDIVTESNAQAVVEALRATAELLIWGDSNNPAMFELFMEKSVMRHFLNVLSQKSGTSVQIQLMQTLIILLVNIKNDTSVYYLLSNNHINSIITQEYDFSDEELLAYYISLLKMISLKLNDNMIQFFFNSEKDDFPLYTEAIKFFNHHEGMIRIAVRTLSLNIFKLEKPEIRRFILNPNRAPYLTNLVWFIRDQCLTLDTQVRLACASRSKGLVDESSQELLDHLYYINDILSLKVKDLSRIFVQSILENMILPLTISCILPPRNEAESILEGRLAPTVALLVNAQMFSVFGEACGPLVNTMAWALLKSNAVEPDELNKCIGIDRIEIEDKEPSQSVNSPYSSNSNSNKIVLSAIDALKALFEWSESSLSMNELGKDGDGISGSRSPVPVPVSPHSMPSKSPIKTSNVFARRLFAALAADDAENDCEVWGAMCVLYALIRSPGVDRRILKDAGVLPLRFGRQMRLLDALTGNDDAQPLTMTDDANMNTNTNTPAPANTNSRFSVDNERTCSGSGSSNNLNSNTPARILHARDKSLPSLPISPNSHPLALEGDGEGGLEGEGEGEGVKTPVTTDVKSRVSPSPTKSISGVNARPRVHTQPQSRPMPYPRSNRNPNPNPNKLTEKEKGNGKELSSSSISVGRSATGTGTGSVGSENGSGSISLHIPSFLKQDYPHDIVQVLLKVLMRSDKLRIVTLHGVCKLLIEMVSDVRDIDGGVVSTATTAVANGSGSSSGVGMVKSSSMSTDDKTREREREKSGSCAPSMPMPPEHQTLLLDAYKEATKRVLGIVLDGNGEHAIHSLRHNRKYKETIDEDMIMVLIQHEIENIDTLLSSFNFNHVLCDPIMFLPPSATPLGGVPLDRRLPSGPMEEVKVVIQAFLIIRNLYSVLCRNRTEGEGVGDGDGEEEEEGGEGEGENLTLNIIDIFKHPELNFKLMKPAHKMGDNVNLLGRDLIECQILFSSPSPSAGWGEEQEKDKDKERMTDLNTSMNMNMDDPNSTVTSTTSNTMSIMNPHRYFMTDSRGFLVLVEPDRHRMGWAYVSRVEPLHNAMSRIAADSGEAVDVDERVDVHVDDGDGSSSSNVGSGTTIIITFEGGGGGGEGEGRELRLKFKDKSSCMAAMKAMESVKTIAKERMRKRVAATLRRVLSLSLN